MVLVRWCHIKGYPFNQLFAIPNGGKRGKATAGRLKASGVKAGVPDLFWPVARNGHHGLFIEMKRLKGGRESDAQVHMGDALAKEGYAVKLCRGFDEAKAALEEYFGGTK